MTCPGAYRCWLIDHIGGIMYSWHIFDDHYMCSYDFHKFVISYLPGKWVESRTGPSGPTPLRSRISAMSMWPDRMTTSRQVILSALTKSGSAPYCSSAEHISVCPVRQAACNGDSVRKFCILLLPMPGRDLYGYSKIYYYFIGYKICLFTWGIRVCTHHRFQ